MKINSYFRELGVSNPIVYGSMGLGGGWNNNPVSAEDVKQAHDVVDCLLDQGVQLIDHADIYTFGKAEQVFGKVLAQRPELKSELVIQSKCGIRFEDELGPGRYDFSHDWITSSVDGILQRLNIEHLPVLLLHRPDPLSDAESLAKTVSELKAQGKIGALGVSNMSKDQIDLISHYSDVPVVVNQLELSLTKLGWLNSGVTHNVSGPDTDNFPIGTLEYCNKHDIQLQSWGSLSQGLFTGRDVSNESTSVQQTTAIVKALSGLYGVSKEAIVLAWLMKHPSNVMPVIGTTNLARIQACCEAQSVSLTREDWYKLFVTARGESLP